MYMLSKTTSLKFTGLQQLRSVLNILLVLPPSVFTFACSVEIKHLILPPASVLLPASHSDIIPVKTAKPHEYKKLMNLDREEA